MRKCLVAIVGRPNVGKSTFFNKICGKRISIVDDAPGVTRDRIYADAEWCGHNFTLVDTGGLDASSSDVFQKDIKKIKKKKKRACILFQNKIKIFLLFQRSSVVEQSAVNRSVVGSSPTAGAIKRGSLSGSFFLCVLCGGARAVKGSLASVSKAV